MKPTRWNDAALAELHAVFADPTVSRDACAERFKIGRIRLYQIAHAQGWLPAERRPSRGPVRYLRSKDDHRLQPQPKDAAQHPPAPCDSRACR